MDRAGQVLALGVDAAQSIVRGDDWVEPWLEGLAVVVGVDCGVGLAVTGTPGRPGSDRVDHPRADELRLVLHGVRPLTPAEAAAATAAAPYDASLRHLALHPGSAVVRMSDLVSLPRVWGTAPFEAIHGIHDARFPAALPLGSHGGRCYFVGLQRRRRDFSDEEVEALEGVRPVVSAALAYRHRLDEACARLQRRLAGPASDRRQLTPRQRDVLALVAAGWSNQRIGLHLGVTERTVRKHLGDIFDRLGVANRTAAALWHAGHRDRD